MLTYMDSVLCVSIEWGYKNIVCLVVRKKIKGGKQNNNN